MFKRANKITSLLVAAAAVASMVPAYAADVKKVDSQDGTVYNAVAYKDGQFYIDGEVNDKDEASYYLANGKYNALSDVDAGSDSKAYGTKYVDINDGDYFVDLTSGKVTSDNVADEARDDAASNLRKKVKNDVDGRYIKDDGVAGDTNTLKDYDSTTASAVTIATAANESKIYSIPGAKFADEWFATAFKNDDKTNGLEAKSGYLNVYTDGTGKYIDGDFNLGKVKVDTTTSAGTKTVYVENTDDSYDTANSSKVYAKVADAKVIAQDKDYIYRFATVTIYTTGATITKIDGHDVNAKSQTAFTDKTATSVSFRALQKISKAQSSGDIGGVKYAKTAYTYILSDDTDDSKGGLKTKDADFAQYDYYTVANGKVVGYKKDGSNDAVKSRTATLKSEDGLYYTDLGSEASEDVEAKDSKIAVDVDVDGNLWRLKDGYLYQWNNDEDWDKVYKVDGSFNEISVYDKNNIVAWNQDDDAYSVIGGKTTTKDTKDTDTTGAATGTTTTAAAGWVKNTDGTWSYNKAGVKATGWVQDGATWYYLNTNGIMQTGWQNVGGTWYFLNASGAMQTGWINDGGTWYYCNASGAMLANTVVDGYVLGASGAWVK